MLASQRSILNPPKYTNSNANPLQAVLTAATILTRLLWRREWVVARPKQAIARSSRWKEEPYRFHFLEAVTTTT